MTKVKILSECESCKGEGYFPVGKNLDAQGKSYIRYQPCPKCNGSGKAQKWVDLQTFNALLKENECPHEHVASQGSFHYENGEVWDDIHEVCCDCGEILR